MGKSSGGDSPSGDDSSLSDNAIVVVVGAMRRVNEVDLVVGRI